MRNFTKSILLLAGLSFGGMIYGQTSSVQSTAATITGMVNEAPASPSSGTEIRQNTAPELDKPVKERRMGAPEANGQREAVILKTEAILPEGQKND